MKAMLLVALLVLPLRISAFCDDWRPVDTVMLGTALTLTVLDWNQTLQFRAHGVHEENRVIGPTPSRGDVNIAISFGMGAEVLAACWLSPSLRPWFLGTVIAAEAWAVNHNAQIGYAAQF